MRKRDWLMAAALVPYVVVMLPISIVLAVLIVGWPRKHAESSR